MQGLSLIILVTLFAVSCGGSNSSSDHGNCDELTPCDSSSVRSFCDIDGVYPGSELMNECIAPPSADACNRIETCPTADKPFCTDDSMGVCVQCLTGQDCGSGEVCNDSNECEAFSCTQGAEGDAACAAADATQPYCGAGDVCVACLESAHCTAADSAICDQADFQCRGCEANPECGSKLCGMDTGICADDADVLYVEKDATGTQCTLAAPCGSIMTAIELVTATRNTILVGAGDYAETVIISDTNISIVGEGTVDIGTGTLGADANAVLVSGNSDVSFDGVNVSPNGGATSSVALRCSSAGGTPTLAFANGTVSGSGGIGIVATNCGLTLSGATVSSNTGGGIDISDSDFSIVNNFVAYNGGNATIHAGVEISGSATTQVFEFNTVVGNQVGNGTATTGVACNTLAPVAASNNIVYSGILGGSAVSGSCTWTYSNVEGGATGVDGNIDMDPMLVNNSGISGDYHLQSGSPCIDAADPAATLTTDIDGEARPQGGRHDMGADEAG